MNVFTPHLRVVQVRAERKDYLDLMTLLTHGVSLPAALGAAQALYPNFAPLVTLKALSYFGDGDLDALPNERDTHVGERRGGRANDRTGYSGQRNADVNLGGCVVVAPSLMWRIATTKRLIVAAPASRPAPSAAFHHRAARLC